MAALQLSLFVASFFACFILVTSQEPTSNFEPCLRQPCHVYAECKIVNGTKPVCVCPHNCSTISSPVCGTDWKTYDNICQMKAKTCQKNGLTRFRYYGKCDAGSCLKTQWSSLRCPFHSECSLYYGAPRCDCVARNCSSDYQPVCGTNGRTYSSVCFLRQAACKERTWLQIRNMGHCEPDPCRSHKCCCGAICKVNETNHATCDCSSTPCGNTYDPVCGSDGNTYDNLCQLKHAACVKRNNSLVLASKGECACARIQCAHYAHCEEHEGNAKCVCPTCTGVNNKAGPVCGTNGVTYPSLCALKKRSCDTMTQIGYTTGACSTVAPPTTISPCASIKCGKFETCIVLGGKAMCQCPTMCPGEQRQVCGSDGVTYDNECQLRKKSCEMRANISLVKYEACDSLCNNVQCLYHSQCVVQPTTKSFTCECVKDCPSSGPVVCGTDGLLYDNECLLKRIACLRKISVNVDPTNSCRPKPTTPAPVVDPCMNHTCDYYGICESMMGVAQCQCPKLCNDPTYPKVCGSDGITYDNICDLQRTSCKSQSKITVKAQGECGTEPTTTDSVSPCAVGKCGFYAMCEVDNNNKARCRCPGPCATIIEPVCGTDGVNYNNECELKKTSCTQKKRISVHHVGLCEPSKSCPVARICFSSCDETKCGEISKMCCCIGCGKQCVTPKWQFDRFVCPRNPNSCLNDSECGGGQLCCPDGCTRTCRSPRVVP